MRAVRVGWLVLAVFAFGAMRVGATSTSSIPNLLVAQTFRLVDDQGVLRGLFETDGEGRVVLSAIAANGGKATQLVLSASEPYLTVLDPSGKELLNAASLATQAPTIPSQARPGGAETPPRAAEVRKTQAQPDKNESKGEEQDASFDWLD